MTFMKRPTRRSQKAKRRVGGTTNRYPVGVTGDEGKPQRLFAYAIREMEFPRRIMNEKLIQSLFFSLSTIYQGFL